MSQTLRRFLLIPALLLSGGLWALSLPVMASETLFLENCAVCHQPDGTGIKNVYPSLVRSEIVRNGIDMALVLLIGRGEMPSFKGVLDSEDMASIINYVRLSFGAQTDTITPARIESLQRSN